MRATICYFGHIARGLVDVSDRRYKRKHRVLEHVPCLGILRAEMTSVVVSKPTPMLINSSRPRCRLQVRFLN